MGLSVPRFRYVTYDARGYELSQCKVDKISTSEVSFAASSQYSRVTSSKLLPLVRRPATALTRADSRRESIGAALSAFSNQQYLYRTRRKLAAPAPSTDHSFSPSAETDAGKPGNDIFLFL